MEFRILGPTEVRDDGKPVPLPTGRGRSLLGVLLVRAGEVVSVDRLIDYLWGETPPATVDTALQGLVSKLRGRLEPGRGRGEPPRLLITKHPGYLLSVESDQIDANRFRRMVAEAEDTGPDQASGLLRAALDMWHGPALADFTYEPFAQSDIAALEELRLTAVEKRIEAELALGHHNELIGELEGLVAEHPLRERMREHLMLALYRSGRQAEALGVYSDLRHTLLDELGLDPAPSLQHLEALILHQDPALDLDDASVLPRDLDRWPVEERKAATVLSVDISVATEGGDEADPEPARRVLDRVHREAAATVAGHGGSVQRVLGSILLGIFGVPTAREDDALRAVRAAVDLRHLIAALGSELGSDLKLRARSGVDTGEVVVGERIGDTMGGSIRGADLLQRAAGEGQILVGEATRLLVGRAAMVERLDAESVADYDRPAWKLVDLAPASAATPVETPMIGREAELARLGAKYTRVVEEGRPHRLTVLGSPGIGKSRLARELAARLTPEARVLVGHCPSSGEGATFWPVREMVQVMTGGFDRETLVGLLDDENDAETISDHVLDAIGSSRSPANPAVLFPMLRRFFEALARRRPLVTVFEDLHWAQPTLLDLVEYLSESARSPIYLVCLARPEFLELRPTWGEPILSLAPLGPEESRMLAVSRFSGRLVPSRVVDEVLEKSQGNPLFVEQLMAAIGEQGDVSVPPTIQALLAARIDRLGPAERDLVRFASVLGHRFSVEALMSLLPERGARHVRQHLRTLERREFVDPLPSGEEFTFRHVLVQEAAYRSLTKEKRAELHERAAAWMESLREQMDETVGYHLERAYLYHCELGDSGAETLGRSAGEKLGAAGLRAFGRFDAGGAENLLARARKLLPVEHPQWREVSYRLAEAHETMGKHGEAETVISDLLARMAEDDPDLAMFELERVWVRFAIGPDPMTLDEIDDLARSVLKHPATEDDDARMTQALVVLAEVFRRSGRIVEMEETLRRSLAHADRSNSARYQLGTRRMLATALEVGVTPVIRCIDECEQMLTWRGRENGAVLPILGLLRAMNREFDLGRDMITRAETLLREGMRARRPLGLVWKRRAEVEFLAGDLDSAEAQLRLALDLDLGMDIREEASEAAALLARVLFQKGCLDDAVEMAELSESKAPAESVTPQALWRSTRALCLSALGDIEEAVRLSGAAVGLVPSAMVNLCGDLHVDRARILLAADDIEGAQQALDEAISSYELKGNGAAVASVRAIEVD